MKDFLNKSNGKENKSINLWEILNKIKIFIKLTFIEDLFLKMESSWLHWIKK